MTRRILRLLCAPLLVFAVLLAVPGTALAQDDNDQPEYPGPFDEANDSPTVDQTADEVLGTTLDGLVVAEGDHTTDRSIDYVSDATSFIAPDIQPAAATTTASGSGGSSTGTGGLANTGSDVEPIIAISVGMLAVGGSVLVGSRRRLRDLFR